MGGGKVRETSRFGFSRQKSEARSQITAAQPTVSKILAAARRLGTGQPANVVITTVIMHEFSGGPWTTAVQGPKLLKYL